MTYPTYEPLGFFPPDKQKQFDDLKSRLVVEGTITGRMPSDWKPPLHQLPARSDVAATKQTVSIDSVLRNGYEHFDIDFIFESFYLPVQVLRSEKYKIEPIKVIEGEDFIDWIDKDDHTIIVYEGCCLRMLQNAKHVGISKRHILSSGQRIAICKLWYGRI